MTTYGLRLFTPTLHKYLHVSGLANTPLWPSFVGKGEF